jgi:D-arabinose 1-dehydrogenase-like Zn-dependent alcohol dehydrogenase
MGRSMGMSPLWGVDPRPDAFKLAKQQGFRDVFVSGEELREFLQRTRLSCDVVIDFVGANDTAQLALDILAYGGLYECVGVAGSITVTTQQLVERDITLQGSLVGSFEDLVNVIALFQSSDCVVTTKEFALEDINSALQALHEGKTFGRIILIP